MRPLISLILLFFAVSLQSQDAHTQAGAPSPLSTIRTTVHLVLEDVVVTDKHGNAITDLVPGDFTLNENWERQKITSFELFAPVQSGSNVPTRDSNKDSQHSNVDGSLTIIVLDALNTSWPDQAFARRKMLQFVKKQPKGQRIAIFGLTSSLFLIQDFTTDPDVLQRALSKSRSQTTALSAGNSEKNIELTPDVPAETAAAMRRMEMDQTRFRLDQRVDITLAALDGIAHSMAAFPQRKNLVWLSGGFPIDLYHNVVAMLNAGDKLDEVTNQMVSYSDRIRQAADALAAAHIAVYPVDARALLTGLIGDPLFNGGTNLGAAQPGLAGQMNPDQSIYQSAQITAPQQTMIQLAEDTGGHAYMNVNDIDRAVALAIKDGSTFYRLGYYSAVNHNSGELHKIEIKIDRHGARARYRRGYYLYDASPSKPQ